MLAGNLYFFFCDVSAYFNQFHTVKQWTGDCIQVIGCCNKQYLGEIIVYIQEVIMERCVLFRVEHFQQCRRRVSLTVGADFVYFIQDEDRIGRTGFY